LVDEDEVDTEEVPERLTRREDDDDDDDDEEPLNLTNDGDLMGGEFCRGDGSGCWCVRRRDEGGMAFESDTSTACSITDVFLISNGRRWFLSKAALEKR
jgi:hypothetical protein